MLAVLVVDDERAIVDVVVHVCQKNGCIAYGAYTAEDALALLPTLAEGGTAIDMIISDYDMGPGLNGDQLIDAVAEIVGPKLVAFLMSARPLEHYSSRIHAFYQKPFSIKAIEEMIVKANQLRSE